MTQEPIHVLSLGAGVQSSTLALMAAAGEITPMPQCAIFADTKAEPKSVYVWLDWLEKQLPFPVIRVSAGSLVDDTLRVRQRRDGKGEWSPSGVPHYSVNPDGTHGQGNRQCTGDFKIAPLLKAQRRIIKEANLKQGVCWIGISLDEVMRMKDSRVKYIKHRWPLIELKMKRHDCLIWMEKNGFPKPPRSACVFCPYHSSKEWRRLKTDEPDEFQRAVQFERDYQAVRKRTLPNHAHFVPYLHPKRIPLSEVDFSTEEERGQINLFQNECEGMCGV